MSHQSHTDDADDQDLGVNLIGLDMGGYGESLFSSTYADGHHVVTFDPRYEPLEAPNFNQ